MLFFVFLGVNIGFRGYFKNVIQEISFNMNNQGLKDMGNILLLKCVLIHVATVSHVALWQHMIEQCLLTEILVLSGISHLDRDSYFSKSSRCCSSRRRPHCSLHKR